MSTDCVLRDRFGFEPGCGYDAFTVEAVNSLNAPYDDDGPINSCMVRPVDPLLVPDCIEEQCTVVDLNPEHAGECMGDNDCASYEAGCGCFEYLAAQLTTESVALSHELAGRYATLLCGEGATCAARGRAVCVEGRCAACDGPGC